MLSVSIVAMHVKAMSKYCDSFTGQWKAHAKFYLLITQINVN